MPRYALKKTKVSTKDKIARAKRYRVWGFKNWIDPFPAVIGTLPEKIVYAALSYRSIPFWFQDEVTFAIPELSLRKDYRPDFVLPGLHLIIEVQGAYWHTKPAQVDADAYKDAVYEQAGWRVLNWWDFDIIYNVNLLFQADPQLSSYGANKGDKSTETTNGRKIIRVDSKGIVTLNRKRAARLSYRKAPPKLKSKYKTTRNYGQYTTTR